MREVTIDGQTHTIVASPFTLYIYTREFGKKEDLVGDLMSFKAVEEGNWEDGQFLALVKTLWAMLKTAKLGAPFPTFEEWSQQTNIAFDDEALWSAVMEEAALGFFRGGATSEAPRQR